MDSELPCRTFTGTVPVDQRARLMDTPREPVTERVTLFRCGFKLAHLAIAKLQLHGDAMDGYEHVEPGVSFISGPLRCYFGTPTVGLSEHDP